MEKVFKAIADASRRQLLDRLFERDGQTLTELTEGLEMTRFGVMKHLRQLEEAGLVTTRKVGREKFHYLNPVPIQMLADRWISKFARPWVEGMVSLKRALEEEPVETPKHVYTIFIRTTPETLWKALTDGDLMVQYFDERPTTTWEVGAPINLHSSAGQHDVEGTVLVVEPHRKLSYSWHALWFEAGRQEQPSRVTWEIDQAAQGTCKLTLVHDQFPPDSAVHRDVGEGWPHILSSLKTLLETGTPLPEQPRQSLSRPEEHERV
jgi:uncharacterized protein YndB with AHSA1/START domain/biotin operon repressor